MICEYSSPADIDYKEKLTSVVLGDLQLNNEIDLVIENG
jgi:hypothetical protein